MYVQTSKSLEEVKGFEDHRRPPVPDNLWNWNPRIIPECARVESVQFPISGFLHFSPKRYLFFNNFSVELSFKKVDLPSEFGVFLLTLTFWISGAKDSPQ